MIGNPAVVGLGGFGMTTLILQFHNLGLCPISPVLWLVLLWRNGSIDRGPARISHRQ